MKRGGDYLMVSGVMYRFDRQTLDELKFLRDEAKRLSTDPETFMASYYGMRLDEFRTWIATGLKPDDEAA